MAAPSTITTPTTPRRTPSPKSASNPLAAFPVALGPLLGAGRAALLGRWMFDGGQLVDMFRGRLEILFLQRALRLLGQCFVALLNGLQILVLKVLQVHQRVVR